MRPKLKIEIGTIHNRLKVIKEVESKNTTAAIFECECSCGKICNATAAQLVHGKKKSCGCQKIDSAKKLCIDRNTTHGLSHTREYTKIYQDRTRIRHKERIKERKKIYQRENKLKVFRAYSKDGIIKCARCGETDDRILNIDHVNGGGRVHQRKTSMIYRDLIKRNFPAGFQVLCQNCNIIKMHENNEMHRKSSNYSNNQKRYKQKLRMELIGHYSNGINACVKCGNKDIRVLCIDHINGGGCQDIKNNGNFWYRLKRLDHPLGFQILCQNCNRRKMYDNDEWRKT